MRLIIFTVVSLFIFSQNSIACICLKGKNTPHVQAEIYEYADIVVKGKVQKIIKPPFWKEPFLKTYNTYVLLKPLEIYKGSIKGKLLVLNKSISKNVANLTGCPQFGGFLKEKTYTLALKYDADSNSYKTHSICGSLPKLDLLHEIQEIENFAFKENSNKDIYLKKLKACKSFLKDSLNSQYSQSFLKYYKSIILNEPISIQALNYNHFEILEIFYTSQLRLHMLIGKDENHLYYFLDCDYKIPKRWHPGGIR